ncbi:hypothetical protein [Streptomyces sp. NPDC055134]
MPIEHREFTGGRGALDRRRPWPGERPPPMRKEWNMRAASSPLGPLERMLKGRGLFLSVERSDAVEVVYVCVDDGIPGGYPVGYVISSRTGIWTAHARVRPGRIFTTDEISPGLESVEEAIRAVVAHARYEDVLTA